MSLDLMFIIANLGDSLPDEYVEFKKMIKNNFENIYDTKLLFEEFKKNEISSVSDLFSEDYLNYLMLMEVEKSQEMK